MYASAGMTQQSAKERNSILSTHQSLLESFTGHLKEEDYAYFKKFDHLIDLEADCGQYTPASAWLVPSEARERDTAKTISSLIFDSACSSYPENQMARATIFLRRCPTSSMQTSLQELGFESGSHVILSCDSTTVLRGEVKLSREASHMHIVRGFVRKIGTNYLELWGSSDDLRRLADLTRRNPEGCRFRLDLDEVTTGLSILRQNMLNLFTKDRQKVDEMSRNGNIHCLSSLRDAIVRLKAPTFNLDMKKRLFDPPPDAINLEVPGCDMMDLLFEYSELNVDQREAVEKAMSANDYSLIQGLPGTGKSSTIAFVARLLVAHGKRVLVTSYTHAAVDNILLKLKSSGLITTNQCWTTPAAVRVGREASVHPAIHEMNASTVAKIIDEKNHKAGDLPPSAEALQKCMDSAKIVGVTVLSIPKSALLVDQRFDVVIVDEAGQISQPAVLGALMKATKFILVGDHMQLPPLVSSEVAERGGKGKFAWVPRFFV